MKYDLNDQIILVTGGSRGIGEAIVRHLASLGARVYFTYNSNRERAESLVEELGGPDSAVAVACNVAVAGDVAQMVKTVVDAEGRIDGLVNNAGITRDNLLMRMSEDDWDAVLDTNLKGVFLCSKAVSRVMMSKRKGRIVNIGSIVGLGGNAGQANYSASKAGLVGFTKSMAKELASRNILVNCVAPGYVATDMTSKLSDEQKNAFVQSIPLKRSADANEIATVISFFLSDAASYVTGQTINVDGGLAM